MLEYLKEATCHNLSPTIFADLSKTNIITLATYSDETTILASNKDSIRVVHVCNAT